MKKHKTRLFCTILAALLLVTPLLGCTAAQSPAVSQSDTGDTAATVQVSNLTDEDSVESVRRRLCDAGLPERSVDTFFGYVSDYNRAIENTSLTTGFTEGFPTYATDKICALFAQNSPDFIGTNCRINAYTLLQEVLSVPDLQGDSSLLFFDEEAIEERQLLDKAHARQFYDLFARVPTTATTDRAVHAKVMEDYYSAVSFPENVSLLSVVFHDNLDGDALFVGHTGVLLQDAQGVLFLEKLSFEEPYQAVCFDSKEEAYAYLFDRYDTDSGEGTARCFLMENGRAILAANPAESTEKH